MGHKKHHGGDPDERRQVTEAEREGQRYLMRAVKHYLEMHRITQSDFGSHLPGKVNQSTVSKWFSETSQKNNPRYREELIPYAEFQTYCTAMGTTAGAVLTEYEKFAANNSTNYSFPVGNIPDGMEDIPKTGEPILPVFPAGLFDAEDNLTNNIADPLFKHWFGTYHCYFYSTLSTEKKSDCFHGILNIPETSQNGCCNVDFDFAYGKDLDRHKKYYGQLVLSKTKKAGAYCTLVNRDDQGEISYLVMANPGALNFDIPCLLAFVLTISGGTNTNHPCVERMILSRKELTGENFERAKAHLLLNDKYIRIAENRFVQLLDDPRVPERFKALFRGTDRPFDEARLSDYVQRVAVIPENWVKSLPGYSEREQQELIDSMRLYSTAPRLNKIKQKTAENDIFELFRADFTGQEE